MQKTKLKVLRVDSLKSETLGKSEVFESTEEPFPLRYGSLGRRDRMEDQRTNKICFRLTDDELSVIREGSEKAGMTFSAFVRSKVLEPDRVLQRDSEKKKLFRDHIYEINRIGNNVNQVARVVNSKQFASSTDLKTIIEYLRKIEKLERELMEKLLEEK